MTERPILELRGVSRRYDSTPRPSPLPDLGVRASISLGSLAIAAVVGIAATAAAPLLTARRLRRMDIPSTLRVVE